jgi:AraC-like DNA-binding protein
VSILVYAPAPKLAHLQRALGSTKRVLIARSWIDVERLIVANQIEVAFLDPEIDGAAGLDALRSVILRYPSLIAVAYLTATASGFRLIADLSRHGLRHVVVFSFDDSADHLRQLLEHVEIAPLTARIVTRLRRSLAQLPFDLEQTTNKMLKEPHRFSNPADLAFQACTSQTRLYRAYRSAGLAPPKKMLVAARLVRGYFYLGNAGYSVPVISAKIGFTCSRIFGDYTSEVFGFTPTRVRANISESVALDSLTFWLDRCRDSTTLQGRVAPEEFGLPD